MIPRVAGWLLRRVLPADVRASVLRDLEEMSTTERARRGRAGGALWVWRQAVSFSVRFGWERVREAMWRRRVPGSLALLDRWWSIVDVRYAVRTLVRAPVVTLAVVSCLAAGVALPVAAFSVLNAMFLQPLPFPDGERVVRLRELHAQRGYELDVTGVEAERRRERLQSYEWLAAYDLENVEVGTGEVTLGLSAAAHVTPELFALARTPPLLGRVLTAEDTEPGAPPVVLIAEGVWRRLFGGEASALGGTMHVKGEAHTVIGVMPARFGFPGDRVDLWLPLSTDGGTLGASTTSLKMVGLLRPGVTVQQAESEFAALLPAERSDVGAGEEVVADVTPFAHGSVSRQAIGFGWAMVVALVLLLLVAASNVANLLLARNAARSAELTVRAALGASRQRLVAQLFLEATMLAAAAGAAGTLLAHAALVRLRGALVVPAWSELDLDNRVLLFALTLALLAALVAGLGPAWKATRPAAQATLKTVGRGGDALGFGRLSGALIVAELCFSVALLGVAAVFARGMLSFGRTEVALPAADVLLAQLYWGPPPQLRDGTALTGAARRAAWAAQEEVIAEEQSRLGAMVAELPGVRAVTFASHMPGMPLRPAPIEIRGEDGTVALRSTRIVHVRPGFFNALGLQPLAGRDFRMADTHTDAAVGLVNASFALRHFGAPHLALGRRVRRVEREPEASPSARWIEIIGIVPDLGLNPGDPAQGDGLYVPMRGANVAELVVRLNDSGAQATANVIETVRAVNADIEVQWTTTLAESLGLPARIFRGVAAGFVLAGAIALALSMLSLYALMAYSVTRRTREIGIRMAIGAPARSVLTEVLGRGLRQMLLGVTLGAMLSLALARFAAATVPFDLARGGLAEIAVMAALLTGAGLAACVRPVRRVLRVDAIHAIRSE